MLKKYDKRRATAAPNVQNWDFERRVDRIQIDEHSGTPHESRQSSRVTGRSASSQDLEAVGTDNADALIVVNTSDS